MQYFSLSARHLGHLAYYWWYELAFTLTTGASLKTSTVFGVIAVTNELSSRSGCKYMYVLYLDSSRNVGTSLPPFKNRRNMKLNLICSVIEIIVNSDLSIAVLFRARSSIN